MFTCRHNKEPKSSGFSVIELVVIIAVIGIVGALGFFVYTRSRTSNAGSSQTNRSSSNYDQKTCKKTDNINFCVESVSDVTSTTNLRIKASLENQSTKDYTTEPLYSSSCSDPSVEINGKAYMNIDKVCTQDITSVTIKAGKTVSYEIPLDVAKLRAGENTLQLNWNGNKLTTNKFKILLKVDSEQDKTKMNSCLNIQTNETYCGYISITFKGQYYSDSSKCEDLEKYVEPLGLKAYGQSCYGDMGVMFVSVPKNETQSWITKIKQLPQVESANSSR